MSVLPQEIQVWYVLPALRRELAAALIERHGLTQKKAAGLLGVSEGAVSQYQSAKRGAGVDLGNELGNEIELSCKRISDDGTQAMAELMRLSELESVKRIVCKLHIQQDASVNAGCDICFR
ncbi:transcriptional regulator [Candidatus Woesearchaeota archaeon]|nr:transcriptional regulator [Candidatus Woesearchaeota archaeon]